MISNKTQEKLDRAAKGLPDENLPEDDQQWQEMNERLEREKLEERIDEMDDDSGEPTNEDHANARYEQQRESAHTNG